MSSIVLATANAGKIRELSTLVRLCTPELKVLGLADFPELGAIEETGSTFAENASLKAQQVSQATGLVALADDSGLVVDALQGAPGIYSARYSGPQATDAENINKLLKELAQVPQELRTAHFVCVMVAMAPDGQQLMGHGQWSGLITTSIQGAGGFGYDPVFFDPQLGLTAAQMEAKVKNERSHRGQAVRALLRGWPEFWARVSGSGA